MANVRVQQDAGALAADAIGTRPAVRLGGRPKPEALVPIKIRHASADSGFGTKRSAWRMLAKTLNAACRNGDQLHETKWITNIPLCAQCLPSKNDTGPAT